MLRRQRHSHFMFTVYRMHSEELDEDFLASLRAAFKNKQIEIAVGEVDETEYLLRSPANREHLLRSIAEIEAGRNLVVPDQSSFE